MKYLLKYIRNTEKTTTVTSLYKAGAFQAREKLKLKTTKTSQGNTAHYPNN